MKRKVISISFFYLLLIAINFTVDIFLDKAFTADRFFLNILIPLIPTFIYAICILKNIKWRPLILVISYLLLSLIFLSLDIEGRGLFTLNVFVTKLSLIPGRLLYLDYLELKLLLLSTLVTVITLFIITTVIDKIFAKPTDIAAGNSALGTAG